MQKTTKFALISLVVAALAGCANQSMPGYQQVYQSYQIPDTLLQSVQARLKAEGLTTAKVSRDSVGRLRLVGNYKNDDEVEKAFIIAQSIVGIKSTSPFYPEGVQQSTWNREASSALSSFFKNKILQQDLGPGKKKAIVIGINKFLDSSHLNDIQGEDDARLMGMILANYGYEVTSVLGNQATKANIEAQIAKINSSLQPNDSLFIYVSSHGNPPTPTPGGKDDRRMSIAAYDSGNTHPSQSVGQDKTSYLLNLQRTSVKDTLIQNLAQKPTVVTRVIVDTCYSGEILKNTPSIGSDYQNSISSGRFETESVSIASWSGEKFTSKGISFIDDSKSSKESSATTADFSSRKNYTFITATSAGELSYGPTPSIGTFNSPLNQSDALRGSFFTQSFMAYLKHYSGDVTKAFESSRNFTTSKVLTQNLKQTPQRFSTIAVNLDNIVSN